MLIAKDLMTASPICVHMEDSIQSVVDLMTEHKLSCVPVIGTHQQFLGIISEITILKIYIRAKANGSKDDKIIDHKEIFETLSSVFESDDISKIVQVSLRAPHHRVFVTDTENKLKGVISPKDILDILNEKPRPKISLHKELVELRAQVESLLTVKVQLKNTEAKLSNAESKLSNYVQLLDASNFMLHSIDQNGKIIFANPRMHLALGYDDGELLGKSISDLYPEHLWDQVEESIVNFNKTLNDKETKYIGYRSKRGEILKVEATTQVILDSAGKFVALSTIARVIDSEKLFRLLNGVLT